MVLFNGKYFISPQELYAVSYQLGRNIFDSGFVPTFVAGLWRGGTPVGITVHETLDYLGIKTDHTSIKTKSYEPGIDRKSSNVEVNGIDYILERTNPDTKLLIVDDVWDRGLTIKAVLDKLYSGKIGSDLPKEIKVATGWYKPTRNETHMKPDFYMVETAEWLVFPHELDGLTPEEIAVGKGPEIASIILGKPRAEIEEIIRKAY